MTDTLTSAPPLTDATTADRLSQFLVANPRAHLRDAAVALSVSELSLLLAHDAAVAVPLRGDSWPDLFAAFETLGEVRTMTRNEWAVIERTGSYVGVQSFGLMGQSVGPELDVRAFFREWRTAWAVTTTTEQGPRLSIQLFDASGEAGLHEPSTQRPEPRADLGRRGVPMAELHRFQQSPSGPSCWKSASVPK